MTDIEAIRISHQPDRPGGFQCCDTCLEPVDYMYPQPVPWPCDTATVLADADALAEALEEAIEVARFEDRDKPEWDKALDAHRARKP